VKITSKGSPKLYEGKRIPFGPAMKKSSQLSLPAISTRVVEYPEFGFTAEYTFTFDGNKLKLDSMAIFEVLSPAGLSTDNLTKLQIPAVMREMVYAYNPILQTVIENKLTSDNAISQIYWAEYVCTGSPRKAVMNQLGIARSTANYHLKKLATAGLVPAERWK
jgi:DNA-binding transcriptional ArsR family regulator